MIIRLHREDWRHRDICFTPDFLKWVLMPRLSISNQRRRKNGTTAGFEPDVVVGIGYWGHTPQLVLHPQRYGVQPVPWLVADGFIANYQEVLNALPLILVTSNWVKEMYVRRWHKR